MCESLLTLNLLFLQIKVLVDNQLLFINWLSLPSAPYIIHTIAFWSFATRFDLECNALGLTSKAFLCPWICRFRVDLHGHGRLLLCLLLWSQKVMLDWKVYRVGLLQILIQLIRRTGDRRSFDLLGCLWCFRKWNVLAPALFARWEPKYDSALTI